MSSNRKENFKGIVFKDGRFQDELTLEFFYDPRRSESDHSYSWLRYHNGYNDLFTIGIEPCTMIEAFTNTEDENSPTYMLEVCGSDGTLEIFYAYSFIDFNALLKELEPIIAVAKYEEEQERRLDVEAKAKGYS